MIISLETKTDANIFNNIQDKMLILSLFSYTG